MTIGNSPSRIIDRIGVKAQNGNRSSGVLLVFTLMVGPAAAAQRLTSRVGTGIALSAGLALAEAWGGIALAYWSDWPASFWITTLSATVYLLSTLPVAAWARVGARSRLPAA